MRRFAAVLVLVLALAFPATAFAHAALEHAGPSIRQRVQIAPTRLWLRFDQRVKPLPNSIVR